jgi:hypothetical protein
VTALIGTDGYVKQRFQYTPLRQPNRPLDQLDSHYGCLWPALRLPGRQT